MGVPFTVEFPGVGNLRALDATFKDPLRSFARSRALIIYYDPLFSSGFLAIKNLLTNTSLALRSPKLPLLKWQQSPHPRSLCKPHRRIAPLRGKRLGDKWKE
jgi:hypothetical protein